MAKSTKIADKYQKKTQLEHILDIPDTYIGSVDKIDEKLYVFDDATNKIVKKTGVGQNHFFVFIILRRCFSVDEWNSTNTKRGLNRSARKSQALHRCNKW